MNVCEEHKTLVYFRFSFSFDFSFSFLRSIFSFLVSCMDIKKETKEDWNWKGIRGFYQTFKKPSVLNGWGVAIWHERLWAVIFEGWRFAKENDDFLWSQLYKHFYKNCLYKMRFFIKTRNFIKLLTFIKFCLFIKVRFFMKLLTL